MFPQPLLDYIAKKRPLAWERNEMLMLLGQLRELEWPYGAPIEPVLLINEITWRPGDLLVRNASPSLGATLYGLVTTVQIPEGLHVFSLYHTARGEIVPRDIRIATVYLESLTRGRKGPGGVWLEPLIRKI